MRWARKKPGASVQFFFEDGATHRGQFKKILMANDGIEPLFHSKEGMPQFQAADLLARKSRKVLAAVVGYDGPGDVDLYKSVNASLAEIKSIPHKYGVHSYESMEPMIRHAKIPVRRWVSR